MRFVRLRKANGDSGYARVVGDKLAVWWSGPPFSASKEEGGEVSFRDEDLLPPVEPKKILCVGRNYAAHAKELGNDVPKEPLLFLKPSSALLAPFGTLVLPKASERVEHEAELAIVIGRAIKNASPAQAMDAVFGYTCAGDITARDLQRKDGQFTRAKGFDGFCPVGPHVETELDPSNLRISCQVNGQSRQEGRTSDMVFAPGDLLSYMSHMMTLEAGDVILTGTPEGVGPLVSGDSLRIEIEKIGALCIQIASA